MAHAAASTVVFERERGVYEILVKRDLAHAVVKVSSEQDRSGPVLRVLKALETERVPIFLIKLHRAAITFAVDGDRVPQVERCVRGVGFDCSTRPNLALLIVIASSMRDLTGVMVDIADSIQRAGARLYGTGDSHNSVQCLIDGIHADAAVAELRRTFGLVAEDDGR